MSWSFEKWMGPLTLTGAALLGIQSASAQDIVGVEGPAAAELVALEARLLAAPSVRVRYDITAKGALTTHLKGELGLQGESRLKLDGAGPFGGSELNVSLVSDGKSLKGGTQPRPFDISTPPALREAVAIGFTRMGLLHNLARLTAGAPPDHAGGGVQDWVVLRGVKKGEIEKIGEVRAVPLSFELVVSGVPSGVATLWLDEDSGLPVQRTQTVHFGSDEMEVLERYGSFEVAPAQPGK